METPTAPRGFRLLDIASLIVGYALASLLVRAFWPIGGPPSLGLVVAIGLEYAWLGLAMSGPIVLAIDRRKPETEGPLPRTWAELAWLIIGYYWIAMTILVVPIRLPNSRMRDSALLGVFPIGAALLLRWLGPKPIGPPATSPGWTHRAAVAMLLTWPLAWGDLILLGKTLL